GVLWDKAADKRVEGSKKRKFEATEIKRELRSLEAWELRFGLLASVRCASFIAQSVRQLGLMQSYVAVGHPRWLDHMYVNESGAYDS
ncbi:hypothetical protein HID58_073426, partial [Brassica napus]